MPETHTGVCYCGAVEIEVRGEPLEMGYCHCEKLPALFRRAGKRVHVVEMGERKAHERLRIPRQIQEQRHQRSPLLHKVRQPHFVDHPTLGLIDVRIGALRNFPFKPKVHLNYAETVLPMQDGLPKLKDFPAEIGGSGETVLE